MWALGHNIGDVSIMQTPSAEFLTNRIFLSLLPWWLDSRAKWYERIPTWVWVHFGILQSIISDRENRFLSTFWFSLWSMLDTKLTKSTAFCPHIDGQTEVVKRMIVHILRMYNSKHPCTWDESLPYVQHSYNWALHNSTNHIPFQVGFGFQPLCPINVAMSFAATQADSAHIQSEFSKANSFIEHIGGHPPIQLGPPPLFLSVFQFP